MSPLVDGGAMIGDWLLLLLLGQNLGSVTLLREAGKGSDTQSALRVASEGEPST